MEDGFAGGFDRFFPIAFFLIAGIIAAVFIVAIVSGIRRYAKNESSPVLTVAAKVVNMRERVDGHDGIAGENMAQHSWTRYYATFQVDSGDRIELAVSGEEYGQLAAGDAGQLTFQGTRYIGFGRNV
jgi:hypothetical protein